MNEVYRAWLNDEGRLVIPAACRKLLGISSGQELLVTVKDSSIHLTTMEQAVRHFQEEVQRLVGPNRSMAGELIEERRAEAAKEASE